jgi:hypothetical protein
MDEGIVLEAPIVVFFIAISPKMPTTDTIKLRRWYLCASTFKGANAGTELHVNTVIALMKTRHHRLPR